MSKQIRQEAKEAFGKFKNVPRFLREIETGLLKVDGFLKKELKKSKEFRDENYLIAYFETRRYYKEVLKLVP